jgi:hypothetical protein
MTRLNVAGATPYRPLTTLETVGTETPAARATSLIVTRPNERVGSVSRLTIHTLPANHPNPILRKSRFEIVIDID